MAGIFYCWLVYMLSLIFTGYHYFALPITIVVVVLANLWMHEPLPKRPRGKKSNPFWRDYTLGSTNHFFA